MYEAIYAPLAIVFLLFLGWRLFLFAKYFKAGEVKARGIPADPFGMQDFFYGGIAVARDCFLAAVVLGGIGWGIETVVRTISRTTASTSEWAMDGAGPFAQWAIFCVWGGVGFLILRWWTRRHRQTDGTSEEDSAVSAPEGNADPLRSGSFPSRPPRIEIDHENRTGTIDNLIGEDLMALGVSEELLRTVDGMDPKQMVELGYPGSDMERLFAAIETISDERICSSCGSYQPKDFRAEYCQRCGDEFASGRGELTIDPNRDIKGRQTDYLSMDPIEFEHEVARLLNTQGYRMEVTTASRDGGVDILGFSPGIGEQKVAVQCKRYQGTVGRPEVQQFWGIISGSEYASGFFVTTGTFSADAKQFTEDKPRLVLVDGEELAKWDR